MPTVLAAAIKSIELIKEKSKTQSNFPWKKNYERANGRKKWPKSENESVAKSIARGRAGQRRTQRVVALSTWPGSSWSTQQQQQLSNPVLCHSPTLKHS